MAPIRRYLRITKYSVLEVRIYLENPALAQSWLLNPRAPVLPRVIESVRPLVLPKLREEKERAKKKNTKKRAIKDVVVEDDFEVAIFLTQTDTRHSLLYKHKHMRDKMQTRLYSNSTKLTGGGGSSRDAAIDIDDDTGRGDGIEFIRTADGDEIPILRREDSEHDPGVSLHDIPLAPRSAAGDASSEAGRRGSKRRRRHPRAAAEPDDGGGGSGNDGDNAEYQVVDDSDGSGEAATSDGQAARKRTRRDGEEQDDKKKMTMDISYEGFAIYGRVLCLVVKRRDDGLGKSATGACAAAGSSASGKPRAGAAGSRGTSSSGAGGGGAGQAMMENWIASTQMPPPGDDGED